MKSPMIAFAMLFGGAAFAADSTMNDGLMRSGDLTSGDIYTAAVDDGYAWDAQVEYSNINPEWNRIGEIEDIVLDADGKMVGVIAEVGGFLDIGDKDVMLRTGEFKMFRADTLGEDKMVFVTGLSKDALMDREDLDEGFWQ